LHGRDEQLETSQAQTAELQNAIEHMHELIPEEPQEIKGKSGVEDN
jgi:hypothetical protein